MFIYSVSFILGGLGAYVVCRYGNKFGLSDLPNRRSSHQVPTPKGGGIGILSAFVVISLFVGISPISWIPISMVSLFGLYGDRVEVQPIKRLIVQFVAALIIVSGEWEFSQTWGLLFIPLWAFFIVGTANFYNFMDGINGIAGIAGIVSFGLLGAFHTWHRVDGIAFWYWPLAASCAGFLPLNFPRARVFMGDVGSILLGFIFAAGVLMASHSMQEFLCMVSFLFPYYADGLTTVYVRLRMRENLAVAHRRHMYQLLVNELGYPHWKIAVFYGVMQAVIGIIAMGLASRGWFTLVVFLFVCSVFFLTAQSYIRSMAARTLMSSSGPLVS